MLGISFVNFEWKPYLVFYLSLFTLASHFCNESLHKCDLNSKGTCDETTSYTDHWTSNRRYILYNVNPGEGFNLRRDVYLRISILVQQLIQEYTYYDWVLVLPPWGPLYHWKSSLASQMKIPWSTFFDVKSLNKFVTVIEFWEFLKENGPKINTIYYLQHEKWKEGEWEDKVDIEKCHIHPPYKHVNGVYSGWFWGFEEVFAENLFCITMLGHASLLVPFILNTSRIVMLDRAEVVLHENFGDANYWSSRRSMRFAKHLTNLGDEFRRKFLNSTDQFDKTFLDDDWQKHKVDAGFAKGGKYIAVHLRRNDFVQSRKKDVPSLNVVAEKLSKLQKVLGISRIFLATDAPNSEVDYLKSFLPNILQYIPDSDVLKIFKEGGVAIIEQWICAHARYFIGTHESTFSFRIQEEREILGFDPNTTFNRFCGDEQTVCEQPSQWRIVYN